MLVAVKSRGDTSRFVVNSHSLNKDKQPQEDKDTGCFMVDDIPDDETVDHRNGSSTCPAKEAEYGLARCYQDVSQLPG